VQKIKNIILIGGGVILVVLGIAGYMIYGEVSTSTRFRTARNKAKDDLKNIYAKSNPFPSKANLDIEKENAENIKTNWASILETVQRVSFPTNETSFNSRCEQLINDLRAADPWHQGERVVTADFGFGFDKYKDGTQPTEKDRARLIEQTYIIEALVLEVYASGVRRLNKVEREVFEGVDSRSSAPVRLPAGVVDVTAANSPVSVSREIVKFDVEADEASLIELLNRLAAMDLFTVVTRVEVTKAKPDHKLPPPAPAVVEGAIKKPPLSRQTRIVSGYNIEAPSKVILDVDVYRFN